MIKNKLKNLSEEDLNKVMEKYYSGVKPSELILEYKLDVPASCLYKLFPPIVCEDLLCPNCGVYMIKDRQSKNSSVRSCAYCKECGHKDSPLCNCNKCKEIKEIMQIKREEHEKVIQMKKRKLIEEVYDIKKKTSVNYESLTFREKVCLGALIKCAGSEDLKYIHPLKECDNKLAPTGRYFKEIFSVLNKRGIIVVSPDSNMDAFVQDDKECEFPYVYYMNKVKYVININSDNYIEDIDKILNPSELSENDKEVALALWEEIALEECLEYLLYQMESVKFEFSIGEKTVLVFKEMLKNFSVSQIYNIIYRGVANATKYYQESNISRRQAANSVIGNCLRYAERALIEQWELTKYSRRYDLKQSVFSEFLYNKVIKIGDLGFNMPPVLP
ncbi:MULTISPECIES: hypothetical protein [Clostridium]|uniref:hypothetical protein n=1 Tax=Clostridium TaxID=1485 RepID=UPI000C079476|nr:MULTISPECIES: hypothetical protein [Clostridium]MDU4726694.1 hypothetical protein [Clostridium sp.]